VPLSQVLGPEFKPQYLKKCIQQHWVEEHKLQNYPSAHHQKTNK
jgi:hypothetical protein